MLLLLLITDSGRQFSPQRGSGHCYMFLITFHCFSGTCWDHSLRDSFFFFLFFFKKKTASNRLQIHMIHSPGHCAETTGSMWAIIVASDHFCPAVIQSNNPRKSFCSQFLSVTDDILSSLSTQLSLFLWTNTFQTLFHWALHFKDELSCLMLKKNRLRVPSSVLVI